MSNEITKKTDWSEVAQKFDELANNAQEAFAIKGNFARTFALGASMAELREAMDDKVMASIMKLKGSPIGFRTDEHPASKYADAVCYGVDVVRECVIQACVYGLQLVGNQFNILAGRFYPTKEGFTYLLRGLKGLKDFKLLIRPAEIRESRTGGTNRSGEQYQKIEREAMVKVDVSFTWNGKEERHELEFCIRVNAGMSVDAVNGKAERKAKAWVFNYLTDNALADADADEETPMRDVTAAPQNPAGTGMTATPAAAKGKGNGKKTAVVDAEVVEDAPAADGSGGESVPEETEVAPSAPSPAPEGGSKYPNLTAVKRVFDENKLHGWVEVYRILDAAGLKHPQMGAPTDEMEAFAGEMLMSHEMKHVLELNGIHFEAGKEAK